MKSKGYKVFCNGDYNLNIVGVRTNDRTPNVFNDWITVFYKTNDNWNIHTYPATTDTGLYYLKNPLNIKGTAILVPEQYRGVYSLGYHQGQYLALVQSGGTVKVYRDNNRDEIIDMNLQTIENGYFGINIHRANRFVIPLYVDRYSAGCQVIKKYFDYREFINLCRRSSEIWGNKFTYTLLEENDLK